jgi:hypothetical protein
MCEYYTPEISGLKFKFIPRTLSADYLSSPATLSLSVTELVEAGYISPLPRLLEDVHVSDLEKLFVIADKILLERYGSWNLCKAFAVVGSLRERYYGLFNEHNALPAYFPEFRDRDESVLETLSDEACEYLLEQDEEYYNLQVFRNEYRRYYLCSVYSASNSGGPTK